MALYFDMAANTFNPHGNDELLPEEVSINAASGSHDPATDLIRQKLSRIYEEEPDATSELAEAEQLPRRSKHQQFMYDLGTSGKDLATVQTEWHKYYESLPDDQKHIVWQEFYSSQSLATSNIGPNKSKPDSSQTLASSKNRTASKGHTRSTRKKTPKILEARNAKEVQSAIRDTVTAGGKLETKHHLQSLLFGLSMGLLVVAFFLFGFFNEVVIAPFIQPSRTSTSTPLIVNSNDIAPTSQPEVIIPKINVEIPVVYDIATTDENTIQKNLEDGVIHYPTTVKPGEQGNAAFFGHSSNNIFNKGKYKFAFVLLHTLVEGDTFYLTYNGKVYVYKVVSKTVVEPSQVGVLGPVPGEIATATLITCDPPGTSLKRLVIIGKQISPDPTGNTQTAAAIAPADAGTNSNTLPGNGPTLFGRFIKSAFGKTIVLAIIIVVLIMTLRWLNKPRL